VRSRAIVANAPSKSSTFCAGSFGGLQGRTVRRRRRTKEHAEPRRLRHGFLQHLQRLGGEVGLQHRQPGDVSARPRQARHVPDADRVGVGGEHDRDRLGGLSGSLHLGGRRREDDVDIHAGQLDRAFEQQVDAFRPPKRDDDGLAPDITEVAQARLQRLDPVRPSKSGTEAQEADASELRRLLRPRGERPKR
jgi:hypothetical protein